MNDVTIQLLKFAGNAACIVGAGFVLTTCLFHLPVQFKKGNKFQCFMYISLGLGGIALFARVFF